MPSNPSVSTVAAWVAVSLDVVALIGTSTRFALILRMLSTMSASIWTSSLSAGACFSCSVRSVVAAEHARVLGMQRAPLTRFERPSVMLTLRHFGGLLSVPVLHSHSHVFASRQRVDSCGNTVRRKRPDEDDEDDDDDDEDDDDEDDESTSDK